MKKMFVCTVCGEYTLSEMHCGKPAVSAHPPPFRPNDPYGNYRRKWRSTHEGNNNS